MTIDVECPQGGRHEIHAAIVTCQWPSGKQPELVFECRKCDGDFSLETVLKLVNAAMQLSATDACHIITAISMGLTAKSDEEALKRYVSRWRGDTEESE